MKQTLLGLFPDPGYFVEAGAHDGIGDSQTYHLEQRGWSGLCVEPSTAYHGLVQNRRCHTDCVCLGSSDGELVLYREIHGNAIELSGLLPYFGDHWDRETRPHTDRMVETVTLTTLLTRHKAPGVIDFMCLDTEGSELAILGAHDFKKYHFRSILVEHNGVKTRKQELYRFLTSEGYILFNSTEIDYFFIDGRISP